MQNSPFDNYFSGEMRCERAFGSRLQCCGVRGSISVGNKPSLFTASLDKIQGEINCLFFNNNNNNGSYWRK